MNGRDNTLGRRLLILAMAFTLVMSGGGQVLCVASDGRVSIEPASPLFACGAGECRSGDGAPAEMAWAVPVCIDLVLAATTHVQPERDDPVTTLRATTPMCYPDTSALTCTAADRDTDAARRERDRPVREESVRSLRSTVLLI